MLTNQQIEEFISQHRLPDKFRNLIEVHYSRLVSWVMQIKHSSEPLFIGISGAQGTGKSTLAAFLKLALELGEGWRVVVLSIDDFYLTKHQRKQLSERVHSLLQTRGVPGTHDMQMLTKCVKQLKILDGESELPLPRFDKALDDRIDPNLWPVITGPIDLVILEGWCVGSMPQSKDALLQPINLLEQERDDSGVWRRYVNNQLAGSYASLFRKLDALVFLHAPNFRSVHRWRLKQEQKLAAVRSHNSSGVMSGVQVTDFIQHYERLTRENLVVLSEVADVVMELDDNHDCMRSNYTSRHEPLTGTS